MSADNTPQFPKSDGTKPVVWTPEDASRFLTSAIHEAQKPLADALKQRPVTSRGLAVIVGILVVAALVIALLLSSQVEKWEKRADAMQTAREDMVSEKATLEAQASALQDKLGVAADQANTLQSRIDFFQAAEETHKRTQQDLSRFRRQNELLRRQISGLEMENTALSRQLSAVRALAEEEGGESGAGAAVETEAEAAAAIGSPVVISPEKEADAAQEPESPPAPVAEAVVTQSVVVEEQPVAVMEQPAAMQEPEEARQPEEPQEPEAPAAAAADSPSLSNEAIETVGAVEEPIEESVEESAAVASVADEDPASAPESELDATVPSSSADASMPQEEASPAPAEESAPGAGETTSGASDF